MIFLAMLGVFFALQAPAPSAKASIEGMVVRMGTNEAVPRARVFIMRSDIPSDPIPSVTSDDQGRYIIKDLDAGRYSLSVQRNGFARQAYGERRSGGGTALTVRAGEKLTDVVFHLTPAGAISGRVVDQTGEPLLRAYITVLKETYDEDGNRRLLGFGNSNAQTDDRGEYRVYLLPPGRYYVKASIPSGNDITGSGYVTTYYPGTRDSTAATAIQLLPGAELNAIDFTLREQQFFRLRGRVLDPKTGRPPLQTSIGLIPRSSPDDGGLSGRYDTTSGTFEVGNVPAGSYWIQAEQYGFRGAGGVPFGSGDSSSRLARMPVDVESRDIDNLVLTFAPDVTIQGQISFDDGNPAHFTDLGETTLRVYPKESLLRSVPFPSKIKSDGTFSIENIQNGEYHVRLEHFWKYYIKTARLGPVDVLSGLTITGPVSDELQLVLGTDAGEIAGTVVDKDHKPVGGAEIVLIPEYQRDRRDLYRTDRSDQNGRFGLLPAVPGNYKIFAWEDLEPGAFNNPDFLQKNEGSGTPLRVPESGEITIELKVIPAGNSP